MSEALITKHIDVTAEKLDELADLAEYWKNNRARGRNSVGIRAAMLMLSQEIIKSAQQETAAMIETMDNLCGPKSYDRNSKK